MENKEIVQCKGEEITFQREKLQDIFDEMLPLFERHWEEITFYKDIKLDVNTEAYYEMEDSGRLRIYTAREKDGKLIGYGAYMMRQNIHYKSSYQALQDVLFIDKEKRGFGGKFILWCDNQLKKEGVQVVYQHIKASHNWGKMAERLGYELQDLIYSKRLDR